MSATFIISVGIVLVAALAVALMVARRSGEVLGPEANYGRELEPLPGSRRRDGSVSPGVRQRAMLAVVVAAVAAIGAGVATALSLGPH